MNDDLSPLVRLSNITHYPELLSRVGIYVSSISFPFCVFQCLNKEGISPGQTRYL